MGPVGRIAALVALLVVAGCGSGSSSSPAKPRYDLTVSYWPTGRNGEARTATLTCDPDGGSHPDPAQACDALLSHEEALEPVGKDVACTQVYGGPQLATLSGTVHALLSRRNGCEIARWEALAPVVELPAG
ncbi:MAG TPA: SSI family serine proteinase inhibitor [Gaiellaceae bacterium]